MKKTKLIVISLVLVTLLSAFSGASAEEYSYTVEEGALLFEEFKDETEFLKDEQYSSCMEVLGGDYLYNSNIKNHELDSYCSLDEWNGLSSYERMCKVSLFVNFCVAYNSEHSASYLRNEQSIIDFVLPVADSLNYTKELPDDGYESLLKIARWQYGFILKNGDIYDFTTGKTYMNTDGIKKRSLENPNPFSENNDFEELVEDMSKKDEVKAELKKNVSANVYLIIAVIILGALWYFERQKRIKADREMDDKQ